MKSDDTTGLKNPERRTASTSNDESACPTCGVGITAITTRGPGRHVIQPCGHRVGTLTARGTVDRGRGIETDGGVSASDLHKFQRDLLHVLREDEKYGLAIKRELEDYYGQKVHHGRLYSNLDDLVEYGLVAKRALDKRTNGYRITSAGRRVLEARRAWENEFRDQSVDSADVDVEYPEGVTPDDVRASADAHEYITEVAADLGVAKGRARTLLVAADAYCDVREGRSVGGVEL